MATPITKHASPLLLKRGVRGAVAGQALDIVVHFPTSPAYSAIGFEFDSAFPGAKLAACLPALARAAQHAPTARLVLFGHADEAGSEDYNKKLSDRRASAVLALLTYDLARFDQVADEDEWALIQYQAMLQALDLSYVTVDGKPGPRTTRGTKAFQQAYNASTYHPEGGPKRAHDALKLDGAIGPKTEAALRDAYLARYGANLDPARFIGPKAAGCGEFNPIGSAAQDRRVVLAMYRPDFPTESKIPCKVGDAGACKVNKNAPHPWKCNFYRRTLEGETALPSQELPMYGEICVELDSPVVNPKGLKFVVEFEDGQAVEGTLDEYGKGRFHGDLNIGYEVHFPELEDDEWSAL